MNEQLPNADQAAERIAAYIEARAQAAQYQETPRPDGIARLAAPFGHQLNETDLIAVARDWAVARARVAELEAERGQLMQLIEDFTDEGDCEFDHHGGCQMHGYLSLKPGELCPHAEAKQRLAAAAPDRSDGNAQ